MFSGIVQQMGRVTHIEHSPGRLRYSVALAPDTFHGLITGASIAIDGVCQTVTAITTDTDSDTVTFDAIAETLSKTTLGALQINQRVNVERSLRYGDEIGGHLLSGHVCDTAEIVDIETPPGNWMITFACHQQWIRYLFPKGFVAIDGASLTLVDINPHGTFTGLCPYVVPAPREAFVQVRELGKDHIFHMTEPNYPAGANALSEAEAKKGTQSSFTVHLIPETLQRTVLGSKTIGDRVNLEIDAQTIAIVNTVDARLR